jgi:LuxR family maltose regulon positive regulatory protein
VPETLLQTKLYIPPLRPNLVPRPRLIQRLNQGLQQGCKLTLVSAPAGFGKTTLVAEWISSLPQDDSITPTPAHPYTRSQKAWLSLDEGDNDPARFLAYLITALNRAEGMDNPLGEGALKMLQSPQPPPAEEVLTSLINDIATIPDRIVLALDDYHVIVASPVDDALTFLLEHLPPQMHLAIATREDPQLPLARLRARGQLTELRAADLRFTSSEAAEFLNQVMGLDMLAEDIATLETRTEGWVAGLQFAALAFQGQSSMQGRESTTDLINSFTGSHRFVLDYLIEEVLEQQSQSIQNFLLQTAVLDRMTGSLCDALTGHDDGQETVESLEHSNLFIIPLDEERRWYRYHHLFSDLLRRRLRQRQPDWAPMLHHRASEWYEKNGFADQAIKHALRTNDSERAAQLIEERSDATWGRGEHKKLRGWLDSLPEEMLTSRPHISIMQARYQCNSGQLDAAEKTLQSAERALDSSTDRAPETEPQKQIPFTHSDKVKLRGRAASTRALICSYQGDVPGIIRHARQALEYLPREDLTWRSVTALTLGNAHGFKGDMPAAYEARSEALKACQAASDIYFVMIANIELAITLREQGRLHRTIEICRQQQQAAVEFGLPQARIVGWLLAVWGETLAELDDLNGAVDRAKKGFKLTERSGDLQMLGWSFMCLIRILISRGDLADAEETIQKMENHGRESQLPPWITNQMAAWQARLWLAQNKLESASQWVEERGLETGGEPIRLQEIGFFLLFDYLILARVLIAQERLDESAKLLQHLLKAAEAGGRISKVIEIKTLQALAFQAGDETDRAMSALEEALTLAEPEGFIRIFVDEGRPMARLLYQALNRGIAPEYVRRLLAAFSSGAPMQAGTTISLADQSELVEPLSERELEVLQLIAEGLTNREIADRLYLSLNTVKVHARNIYGKLDAHSRTQAVARVRNLGILPPT